MEFVKSVLRECGVQPQSVQEVIFSMMSCMRAV